tara:strand:- start:22 stop:180 length:159 start_codon:yes stop_codon:yes gene_type:complete
MSFLSSARRLGYLFTDFHDHENVDTLGRNCWRKFSGRRRVSERKFADGTVAH